MSNYIRTTESRASKATFKCVAINNHTGRRNCFYASTFRNSKRYALDHIKAQHLTLEDFHIEPPTEILRVSSMYQ